MASEHPFPSVVCGIDGTREAFEAARQAARLTAPGGRLVLLAATHFLDAVSGRWGPELIAWDLLEGDGVELEQMSAAVDELARESVAWARRQVGDAVQAETRVTSGRAYDELGAEAGRAGATLIAVGAHGGRRLVGAALGDVATMLLHEAAVSVLLARPPFDPVAFPWRVVVGLDGSEASMGALAVADAICRRSGGDLTVVVATRDDRVELEDVLRRAAPHRVAVERHRPVEALTRAAAGADLLVVGSRGVGGVRALGSVSERVAHRAASSVLVVRG